MQDTQAAEPPLSVDAQAVVDLVQTIAPMLAGLSISVVAGAIETIAVEMAFACGDRRQKFLTVFLRETVARFQLVEQMIAAAQNAQPTETMQ